MYFVPFVANPKQLFCGHMLYECHYFRLKNTVCGFFFLPVATLPQELMATKGTEYTKPGLDDPCSPELSDFVFVITKLIHYRDSVLTQGGCSVPNLAGSL